MSETNENTNDLNEVFTEEMIDADVITVPIDDTLSNSGEAADAAAVGAALALKADASSIVTISVNGQTPDNQGVILVTANDTKMSSTDATTIKDAIETVDAKTGADIPVNGTSGASSIADAISSIGDKTAENIPMSTEEDAPMISAKIASMDQTAIDLNAAITTVNAKTGANIQVSGTDTTKISDALAACVKTVNGSTPDADGDVAIDAVPFADNLRSSLSQNITGTFNSRTTGANASVEDGDAWLTTLRGNRVHTGYTAESINMTVTPVEREQGEDTITATIDRDTFVAYVSSSGTTTLTYTTSWSASPTLYGITVSGTPKNGDEISVVYVKEVRGTITPADPQTFVATGWNLYNHTNTYARAIKYSDEYGFCIEGTYTAVKFSTTLTGDKTTITPVDGHFNISSSGYIWVEGGNNTDTQVYMTWSDWVDTTDHPAWAAYSETVISLTSIMDTYFPYGLLRVGDVRDEINLNAGLAISNVERLSYSAENLAEAVASGRVYEYDENYIYLERASAVTNSITLDGAYDAFDHGIEYFTGTTTPVYTAVLYGNNLKNKLERDVLTISAQSLTSTQKAQVRTNIDAMIATPTEVTASSNQSNLTINAQSCYKIGKLVVCNIRFTTSSSTSGVKVLMNGLPKASTSLASGQSIGAVSSSSEANFTLGNSSSNGSIFSTGTFGAGTYQVSCVYIAV